MVGQELKDAFNKLDIKKGSRWHSINELRTVLDKNNNSIRTKLKRLLLWKHVKCKRMLHPITYNIWDTGKEITVNKYVTLWRLV